MNFFNHLRASKYFLVFRKAKAGSQKHVFFVYAFFILEERLCTENDKGEVNERERVSV